MIQKLLITFNLLFFLCFNSCVQPSETENTKLIANAGEDQITIVGSYAIFDPTKSTGNIDWYQWEQDESNPDTVNILSQSKQPTDSANIDKIIFVKEGTYKFRLIVKSDYKESDGSEPDEVTITVNSNPNSKFEDPNLEGIIRAKLNIQTDDLDQNTLLNLISLSNAEVIPVEKISSLKGIENCKNLTSLMLGSQNISDISPLSFLTKLKVLWLDQNRKISDVTPLKDLTELEELNLDSNLLTDISPLENLVKLKYLNLQLNPVQNISAIQNMKELETLEFFQAFLEDISSLSKLNNLQQLWIVDSGISDISSLSNLKTVRILHIAWNNISDLSPLSNMKKLEWIALEQNNISDISPLQDLENLGYVRLWDNQIIDIKPLVENSSLGEGDIVGLDDNPLSDKSINEYIPELQARGVSVTW